MKIKLSFETIFKAPFISGLVLVLNRGRRVRVTHHKTCRARGLISIATLV